ncbi:hypothetical protein EKD04_017125 [Chloroflexales bacterium ZM16-3]|nr:hypothetical protein [Chloroflexales bacterium ZM16-3]
MNIHIGDRALRPPVDTHPDWIMGYSALSGHLIIGASAVGQLHLHKQLPRDDAFMIRSYDAWVAVAVADGVGSRPLSRYGATYAVESLTAQILKLLVALLPHEKATRSEPVEDPKLALSQVVDHPLQVRRELVAQMIATLDTLSANSARHLEMHESNATFEEVHRTSGSIAWHRNHVAVPSKSNISGNDCEAIIRKAFDLTHRGLQAYARDHFKADASNLSCTALVALVNLETGQGAIGQVGDGAIIVWDGEKEAWPPLIDSNAEDPQATHTITALNYTKYLAVQPLGVGARCRGLFLMTDGVSSDLLYAANAEQELAQRVSAIHRNLQQAKSPAQGAAGMLRWLATFQSQGNWDDRTLVAIIRQEPDNANRNTHTGQR